MKIDRQLGIITILLQQSKVTAPELAGRFEVSRRTILRDIDDICKAGIPVVTCQGGDGGIRIAEGYKLDKSVLTVDELNSIVAGLKGIGSVTDASRTERLINKLAPEKKGIVSIQDSILIDLASHYKSSLSEKIELIGNAIKNKKVISFDYYSAKGKEKRRIEPYIITFKWTAWYVYGFCREKEDFRLFKLNRLWKLCIGEETFQPRDIPRGGAEIGDFLTDKEKVTILFDKSVEYLLVDEYGPYSYEETSDGKLRMTVGYTNIDHMIRWILGFGGQAEVLEPEELAGVIGDIAEGMAVKYGKKVWRDK
ncbi:MAG TPA: YafY family protein [Clostridia bacterium]|nr:YafY family protein [Clostridia bacterium]